MVSAMENPTLPIDKTDRVLLWNSLEQLRGRMPAEFINHV
ncbi:unnamed protein product, partial [Rotaria sp. Silwood2]